MALLISAAELAEMACEAIAAGRNFLGLATTFLPPSCVPLPTPGDVAVPFQFAHMAENSSLFSVRVWILPGSCAEPARRQDEEAWSGIAAVNP